VLRQRSGGEEAIMTMVGQRPPLWRAVAYLKGERIQISSADYDGKWYVLYWYPLDFGSICPTEIKGFQALLEDFKSEGVEVVGASTDSFHSHCAWFADRTIFPHEITHPVIADTSHSVSKAFAVLKEDEGVAYRATAVVDEAGMLRATSANDLSVGRSPREILRTVQALRAGGSCGADWQKDDEFVREEA
jgi:alkyl hydroperoxide reductase subunit AhpC